MAILVANAIAPVAHGQTTSWTMGVYYANSVGSTRDWAAYVWPDGFPADAAGDLTGVVFTASTDGYFAQIAIARTSSLGPYLDTELWAFGCGPCRVDHNTHSLSNPWGSWHTMELRIISHTVCGKVCTPAPEMAYYLDSTNYDTFGMGGTIIPYFDNEMVPSMNIESYDSTASDFSSSNTAVYGYFQYTVGTNTGGMYLYPGGWGAVYDSCSLPSGAQTTTVYVGTGAQAPNTVGVSGHVWDSIDFGPTYQWGIGYFPADSPSPITDSTLSSHCNPLPHMS